MTQQTSPLRYPGGKFRARKILEQFLPEKVTTVISPFIGGGSFELYLTDKNINVYGYDGFKPLANFWEHLLSNPRQLATTILGYGKISSSDFKAMQQHLTAHINTTTSIKDAAQFFIVNRCSFSGATLSGGYSTASAETRFTPSSIHRVEAFHNPLLHVEHKLFEQSLSPTNIKKHKPDLLFLDPPYLLTKTKNVLYGIGGDLHKTFDHTKLHSLLIKTNIPFLLTYNDCPEIREMYADQHIYDTAWAYGMNSSKKSSEIIITNYLPPNISQT